MADVNEHVQYSLPRYQLSPSVAAICYKVAHLECQGLRLVFSFDHELQTRFVKPGHLVILGKVTLQITDN